MQNMTMNQLVDWSPYAMGDATEGGDMLPTTHGH